MELKIKELLLWQVENKILYASGNTHTGSLLRLYVFPGWKGYVVIHDNMEYFTDCPFKAVEYFNKKSDHERSTL